MKKLLSMLLATTAVLVSCTTPTPEDNEFITSEVIELSVESVEFQPSGNEAVDVQLTLENCEDYEVLVPETDTWLTAEAIVNDTVSVVRVSVADNTTEKTREATVLVACIDGEAEAELTVTQYGITSSLSVETKKVEFVAAGGVDSVAVTSNVDWTAECEAEWVTVDQYEGGVVITAAENTVAEERTATVKVTTGYSASANIKVNQEAAVPVRVREDEKTFVPYTEVIYEQDSRKGYGIENICDNNLDTYWSCPNSGIDEHAVLTFVFDGRYRIDYMDYYPSPDYGQWGEVEISYKSKSSARHKKVKDVDFGMKDGKQRITFDESLTEVEEIVVEVKTAKGRSVTNGLLAGAAEVEFFYSDDKYLSAVEVFTDESCSEFRKKDFSESDLAKIQDEKLRDIAAIMMTRTAADNEFRVATYKSYPSPQIDADRFMNAKYSEYDNVTGILLLPGKTYTICVAEDFQEKITPRLTVINYKTPKFEDGKLMSNEFNWSNQTYALTTGINEITIPANTDKNHYGGLCYIKYQSVTDATIKINFVDGEVNGYWDTEMHSTDRWEELLNKSLALEEKYGFPAHFDMRSPRIIMSFHSQLYQSRTKTGERAKELIGIYNEIIELEEDIQGHKLFNTGGHRNRMHMVGRYGGSYMYATDYHTGYNVNAAPGVLDPDGLRESCWGAAHEFGHVNQVRPILKWVGTTEVTNNICSAYVQWTFNKFTVLGNKTSTHGYNAALRDCMARGCSHVLVGSWDAAYYLKVVPFFQLYLYFTEVKGMTDFYPRIYEESRNDPDARRVTDEEAMLRFCERVSDIVKLDMTEFFERWGFLTPVDVYFSDYGAKKITIGQERIDQARKHMAQYPKPEQPIWFISESNLHLFKEPAEVKMGKVAHTSGSVRYHFQNWENCVAYVVEGEDGKWYGITDASTAYVDTKWNTFKWVDENGVASPDGQNSKTYYCTGSKYEVSKVLKNVKCYGVDANGKFHEFK